MKSEIVGRLIRSRRLAHPSGFPSMSLDSGRLHSMKRRPNGDWRLTQTPYNWHQIRLASDPPSLRYAAASTDALQFGVIGCLAVPKRLREPVR